MLASSAGYRSGGAILDNFCGHLPHSVHTPPPSLCHATAPPHPTDVTATIVPLRRINLIIGNSPLDSSQCSIFWVVAVLVGMSILCWRDSISRIKYSASTRSRLDNISCWFAVQFAAAHTAAFFTTVPLRRLPLPAVTRTPPTANARSLTFPDRR